MNMLSFLLSFLLLSPPLVHDTLPPGKGIPVVLYHGLTDNEEVEEEYVMSQKRFKEHLIALKEAGYTTISSQELYDYYYNNKPLPLRAIMLTFDDGRVDSYTYGDPVLKELGMHAVLFISSIYQEEETKNYLSWATLKEMLKSGRWDIQSHGYKQHRFIPIGGGERGVFGSNLLWLEEQNRLETFQEYKRRLNEDLKVQVDIIESNLPKSKVIAFSYPYGAPDSTSKNIKPLLAEAINHLLVSKYFPLSFAKNSYTTSYRISTQPHLMNRFVDEEKLSAEQFLFYIQNAPFEKKYP